MPQLQFEYRCPWCNREVDFAIKEIQNWSPHETTDYSRFMPMLQELVKTPPEPPGRPIGMSIKGAQSKKPDKWYPPEQERDRVRAWSTVCCPKCRSPVLFLFDASVVWLTGHWFGPTSIGLGERAPGLQKKVPLAAASQIAHGRINVLCTFPSSGPAPVPKGMPERAAEIWPSTLRSLDANDPPSRIVGECRSVLDVCLQDLKAEGKTRKKRIANLRDRHILTEGMATWADKVWDDGNNAIHEIQATREQAVQHVAYLKLFLHVVYELPAQIREQEPPAGSAPSQSAGG